MDNAQAKVYPEKSIAVLPFVNMSADPENEYFSDGITEEIINALTKVPGLKVTARTSAFAFKNKNSDIPSASNWASPQCWRAVSAKQRTGSALPHN